MSTDATPQSLVRKKLFAIWTLSDWIVILIGGMAMTATYPGRTYGLGMVAEPLMKDFHLGDGEGRVAFATMNFWATLIGSVFCIPAGWIFDRYGRRMALVVAMTGLGGSVVVMSYLESTPLLSLALLLSRGFGQSALSVVSIGIVAKSFEASRVGLAMAVYSIITSLLHIALIKSVSYGFESLHYEWRTIWQSVGLGVLSLSLMALFLPKEPMIDEPEKANQHEGYTLFEAISTPAFWTFGVTISIWGMIYAGVALFNEDIFRERGFDRAFYFEIMAISTMVAPLSNLLFGWLARSVPLTRLLFVCMFCTSLSLLGLPLASLKWHMQIYGVVMGISSGAVAVLFFAAWSKLYGQKQLGKIQGVAQMLTVFASAVGPILFSLSKRSTTSYTPVFFLLGAVMFAMSLIAIVTPLPKPRGQIHLESKGTENG